MLCDRISDYVEGVTAKYLSVVDAAPNHSHGHEIAGLASNNAYWLLEVVFVLIFVLGRDFFCVRKIAFEKVSHFFHYFFG